MKIRITERLKEILCIPITGLVMVASLSGCAESKQEITSYVSESNRKIFGEGEHIISVPISDPTQETIQYEYHEGYKPVGITTDSYGEYAKCHGKSYIVYTNEYPVNCYPTYEIEGELLYTDFGTPIDYERDKTNSGNDWQEYNIGEHIISVPLDNNMEEGFQIQYHDGYEVVGIASSAYGKYAYCTGGGCILYKNTKNVKCIKDETGNYTSFGIPEEDTKVLQK